jgi:tetratricopeptide (TPR) repeat protein
MSTPPEAPAPEPTSALVRWAPLLVLLVVALAWIAHWSVLGGGWLLDDARLVRGAPTVGSGPEATSDPVDEAWLPSATASGTYGPLVRASFALEAPLWTPPDVTPSPRGFHLTNLLLHGLCALLLFLVLVQLLPHRPVLGLAAALCFAAHPIHAGTIGALMGRAELLATFFSLLTVLFWRNYRPRGWRWAWIAPAALAWLLAILSKEVALGVPLVLFVLDRALPVERAERTPPLRHALGYAALALPLVLFALTWGGPGAPLADLPAQNAGVRLLHGLEGLGRMVLHVVIPVGFRGDHTDEAVPGTGYEVDGLGMAVAAVVALLGLLALVRALAGRGGFFGTSWLLFLALALPAILAAPAGAPLEHRFAYLVSLPLIAGLGALVEGLALRAGRADAFGILLGVLAGGIGLVCLVGLSHREAAAWSDDLAWHNRLLERNPQHVRAMVRLARNQRLISQDLRARAARLRADSPVRRDLLDERAKSLRIARAWSARAVHHELGRRSAAAWRELGLARLASDENASALTALKRALELDPVSLDPTGAVTDEAGAARVARTAEVHHAIGQCRAALGRRETAADAYLMAARLAPDRIDYAEKAGLSLCRANRYAEGITLLRQTMRRARDPASRERLEKAIREARVSARRIGTRLRKEGRVAQGNGQWKTAVRLYEQAMAVNPKEVEAFIYAGYLRGWYFGNYDLGFRYLDEAERLLDRADAPKDDPRRKLVADNRRRLEELLAEEDE